MDLDFDDQLSNNAAPAVRAGARFKPKGKPQPKKKQVPSSTTQTTFSTQSQDQASLNEPLAPTCEKIVVPENGTINQSEENVDLVSRGWSGPSILHPCHNVDLEPSPTFLVDPETQHSAVFGDSMTHVTYEDINAQTEEEECHLDMETLDIVQEEGITSSYDQHSGKFQPKPRLVDTVIQEPEPRYSVDDDGNYTNDPEFMANEESTRDSYTFYDEEDNINQASGETVAETETQTANNTTTGEEENIENPVEEEPSGKGSKKGKSKRGRKRKEVTEEEQNKGKENAEKKKKFKHATRRPKRTLEKELLETPDDEIRFLPIRDMLRLVEYKEWLEKKEAKAGVVPPPTTQESSTSNVNAWGNNNNNNQYQYQSQDFGFGAEDEFGMEESGNQDIVKPDSPVNYHTYMNKTPRVRWSKQDTELFYEGIREFGSNMSMIQQLFPDRTREQMKLKFKLEERKYPLKLNDALSTRSKDLTHFQNVIKKLKDEAAAAKETEAEEEGEGEDVEAGEEAETTTDVRDNEPAKFEETERAGDEGAGVKESDGEDVVKSDGEDDDFWNSYKSDL